VYSYDGLGRRTTENPGTLRDIYFSSAWQVVEEDVSGSMQDQYVWSPVYIDAMVERDTPSQRLYVQQDANWNVTALVNVSGIVVERYIQDPYGSVTYLNASWGALSRSAYSWVYIYQGSRLDNATGLFSFRLRDYSPTLGRWVQVDPVGFQGNDVNTYRSIEDSPTTGLDPTGEYRSGSRPASTPWELLPPIPDFTLPMERPWLNAPLTGLNWPYPSSLPSKPTLPDLLNPPVTPGRPTFDFGFYTGGPAQRPWGPLFTGQNYHGFSIGWGHFGYDNREYRPGGAGFSISVDLGAPKYNPQRPFEIHPTATVTVTFIPPVPGGNLPPPNKPPAPPTLGQTPQPQQISQTKFIMYFLKFMMREVRGGKDPATPNPQDRQ
jgi:RHS repeat-associated protein